MKYWYDTEFIEDGHTIDLISIGVVAEDGRTYYAISTEFDESKASQWVKDNVIVHLSKADNPCERKSRQQIKEDLLNFCAPEKYGKPEFWGYYSAYDHVVLCQLFGTMMELPKGWPMFTQDIQQLRVSLGDPDLLKQDSSEHHALADALWTKQAYEFLQTVKAQ